MAQRRHLKVRVKRAGVTQQSRGASMGAQNVHTHFCNCASGAH